MLLITTAWPPASRRSPAYGQRYTVVLDGPKKEAAVHRHAVVELDADDAIARARRPAHAVAVGVPQRGDPGDAAALDDEHVAGGAEREAARLAQPGRKRVRTEAGGEARVGERGEGHWGPRSYSSAAIASRGRRLR